MSALARVELLSSGASAIYGSDAIGGVMNFITKRDMDQTEASVTGGMYQQGVGETLMGSVITGNSFERGSFTVGLDGFVNDQILASDVDYLKEQRPVQRRHGHHPAGTRRPPRSGSCVPVRRLRTAGVRIRR